MPALLLHAAAVERLAAAPRQLPAPVARALAEDIEYARFGALLPDLPWCEGYAAAVGSLLRTGAPPPFCRLFHERAPLAFGLKLGELVASGSLVGREPGLAVVTGYFTHLMLDRRLHPRVARLVQAHRLRGESPLEAHRRIEWAQAVYFLREQHGVDVLGTPVVRTLLRLGKSRQRGVGGGLYELVRLASMAVLGEAPSKQQVDGWTRGAALQAFVLASPVGKLRGTGAYPALAFREFYRTDEFDVAAEVDAALDEVRGLLGELLQYLSRASFTRRTRDRFLRSHPDVAIAACAA